MSRYARSSSSRQGARGGAQTPQRSSTVYSAAAWLLSAASFVARVLAWASVCMVVVLCFTAATAITPLSRVESMLVGIQPVPMRGILVLPTPFGGAFRGDLSIFAVALFVIDYVLVRVRAAAFGTTREG